MSPDKPAVEFRTPQTFLAFVPDSNQPLDWVDVSGARMFLDPPVPMQAGQTYMLTLADNGALAVWHCIGASGAPRMESLQ